MSKVTYYIVHDISRFICFLFFKIFCCMKIYGRENIPKKGGFILASNHLSYLDPPAVGSSCPRRLSYMARHDLFIPGVISWLYKNWGAFPVKRGSPDISALKTAINKLNSGEGLLLFPEGSRRADGELSKPQAGIGFIAAKAEVPVIPAYVWGTDKVLPKGATFFRLAKVSVRFGKQIFIDKNCPYDASAEKIMQSINGLAISNKNFC